MKSASASKSSEVNEAEVRGLHVSDRHARQWGAIKRREDNRRNSWSFWDSGWLERAWHSQETSSTDDKVILMSGHQIPSESLIFFSKKIHLFLYRASWEVKASACNVGDLGSIPGSGRSPGEGNGNPLQYSCLENHMDRGTWWATVHRVARSRTRLSDRATSLSLFSRDSNSGVLLCKI